MDYELKYLIAIFLIVEIAALSPEFSVGEEKEKPKQGRGQGEAPLAGPAAEQGDAPLGGGPALRRGRLGWGAGSDSPHPMKVYNAGETKKTKENSVFLTCEHRMQLLERHPKWRNIQKTLHWLNRLLSSNRSSMKMCVRRKTADTRAENYEFRQSKTGEHESFPRGKKPKRERESKSDLKLKSKRGEEKKVKRKRKYKHKSWRGGREKLKSQRKGFRYLKKHFSQENGTAILKPSSVLFDVGETFLRGAEGGRAQTRECLRARWSSKSLAVESGKNCEEKRKNSKETSQEFERKSMHSAEGWSGGGEARGGDAESKLPQQKAKPWPHFVYHRVSSNSLHPEPAGHSHRQSAYVAISVATSTKPETTDNNS